MLRGTSLFAFTFIVFVITSVSEAQIFDWNNGAGGNFNLGTNWSPGIPSFLSGADETLNFGTFGNGTVAGYTATNNVTGGAFTRVINFNNAYGSPAITLANSSTTLTFNSSGGLGAQLNQNGFGLASIGAFTMANGLTIGGAGAGNLTVTGAITNNAGAGNVLTINQSGGGFANTGASVIFNTGGTWAAGSTTVIQNGNVVVGSATALGSAASNTITFNSGSFRFNTTGLTLANNFTLNNTMNLLHSTGTTGTNTLAGIIGGTGGLNIAPTTGLSLALTGRNTFSGDLVYRGAYNATGFGVTLSGAAGSIANVNNISVFSNSGLTLDNATTLTSGTRLSAGATVNLNSARLSHQGNASAATSTAFDTLNSVGQALLVVNPGAASLTGGGSTLTVGTWNRTDNSTAFIQARALGLAPGANVSTIVLTNNPGGAIGGLLPYAVVNTSSAATVPVNTFVRWDAATGRLAGLSHTTDYQGGLPATQVMELYRNTSSTANYRGTTTQGSMGNTTVNSLILDSTPTNAPFVGVSIAGSGTLNVTSGAILSSASANPSGIRNTIAMATLNFGSATGYIHTAGATSTAVTDLNITSTITGSGGLVKAGFGTLNLTGSNTFSGNVFVNAGSIAITSDANLGASSNEIRLNNGNLTIQGSVVVGGLAFSPNVQFNHGSQTTLTTSRNISLGASGGSIFVNNVNNTMFANGTISGSGFLLKGGFGTLVLNGTNSYTGETVVFDGVLVAANDAAMGNSSGNIVFAEGGVGVLQAGSSFSSNRNVLGQSTMQLFTNGNNLTLNGVLGTQKNVAPVGLTKLGTGDLVLTNTNTFGGATIIGSSNGAVVRSEMSGAQTGGRLVLSGANGSIAMSSGITVNNGSTLRLDNSAAVNNFRVGRVAVAMNAGTLEVIGNSSANTTTSIGALTPSTFANTVTLDQSTGTGSTTNTLVMTSYANPTSPAMTFIRGTNLGASSGNRTAVLINNTTGITQVAGILPSFVGSGSATGNPTEFLRLGTAVGGQTPLEIFTAYSVNALSGSGLVSDITTDNSLGAASELAAARLSSGNVDLAGFAWTLNSGSLITVGNRSITNSGALANLTFGGTATGSGTTAGFARITNNDDLIIGSNVVIDATNVTKFGAGALTLDQAASAGATTWNVAQGTLRYGSGVATALPADATVNLAPGGNLDLNNNAVTLANVMGYGNLNVGTGGLTQSSNSGALAATMTGSGAMTLNGTGNFTVTGNNGGYTGNWNVNAGTLTVGSNKALGSGRVILGNTTGSSAASLSLPSISPNVAITNSIVVQNGSTGLKSITAAASTSGVLSGNIVINDATSTGLRLNGSSSSTGAWTHTGAISGSGNLNWFFGNWNLWGNNSTWTGNTTFDAGTGVVFGVGSDSAFGTGTVTWTTSGGMLRADNGARTLANNIFVAPSANAFTFTGVNDITLNGTIRLSSTAASSVYNVNLVNTGVTTFNGVISEAAATATIRQTGFGTLVLGGANTFTGGYFLNSGTLGLANNSALGTGTFTVNEGGVVRAVGGARNIANAVTIGGNFAIDGSNALNFQGAMNLQSATRTAVVRNTAATTFSGVISGTSTGIALIKEGSGRLNVTNANTYSGSTTVAAGSFFANNLSGSATGAGDVTVNSSALLGGTGSIAGALTVNGTLAPGSGGIESLESGTLTMNSGSTYQWETLDSSSIGADLMKISGALSLDGVNLDLALANLSAGTWAINDKLTLIAYGGAAISSGFTGYLDDATYTFGLNQWVLNYNDTSAGSNYATQAAGSAHFITFRLNAVPEPSALGLLLVTCAGLSLRRRRAA